MTMRPRFRKLSLTVFLVFCDQLLLIGGTSLQNNANIITTERDNDLDRTNTATAMYDKRSIVRTHILKKRSEEDNCNAEYYAENGALMSPNYPETYEKDHNCNWLITVPEGYVVMLTFFDVNLPSNSIYFCSMDNLSIREEMKTTKSLGLICGTSVPDPIISNGNSILIMLTTESDIQGKGFHAGWFAVFIPCLTGWDMSKFNEGVVVSCMRPLLFGPDDNSSYSLAAENCSRQGTHLLTITSKQQDSRVNDVILYNNIYYIGLVKNATSHWAWITEEPYAYSRRVIPSQGDKDNCVNIRKWTLQYAGSSYMWASTPCSKNDLNSGYVCEQDISVAGLCGGAYNATNGTILSPNYPQIYNTGEICEWIITTTENHILQLIFTHMDIANSTNCRLDRVTVRDGDNHNKHLLGKFCGNEIPYPIETIGTSAWIRFVSTYLPPGTGFQMLWTSEMNKCGDEWNVRLLNHVEKQSCYRTFYFRDHEEQSHNTAVQNCMLHRSHLVTITDVAENQYLGRAVGVGRFYIGLRKDFIQNDWTWNTGELFKFTELLKGDPIGNDCAYAESVVVTLGDHYLRWHGTNCTSNNKILGYICEKFSKYYCTYLDGKQYDEGDQWDVDCDLTCECQDAINNTYYCQQMCVAEEIDATYCELVTNPDNPCCTSSQCDYSRTSITTESGFITAKETSDLNTITSSLSDIEVILYAVIPVLSTIGIAVACGIIYRRRLRGRRRRSSRQHGRGHDPSSCFCVDILRSKKDAHDDALVLSTILKTILDDDVQIQLESLLLAPNAVHIGEQLGKGAFGTVFKGTYENPVGIQTIAIKTLADNCIGSEISAFVAEAITMSELDHNHVLSIVGVCINLNTEVPMIVLPFMEHGDLKKYLRQFRYEQADVEPPDEIQLLIFCLHIARGMIYLSNLKFIHRDLAARNCMLDSNLVVKVADFGLTRDIYSETYYRQDQQKLLPVKWMSLESLRDHVFTVYSDIWSYGVTAWEVMSHGKVPYPELDNSVILRHLETGGRLPQPNIGPDFMYILMMDCWNENTDKRPTFNQIAEYIADYLAEKCDYLDLNTEADSAITMATRNVPPEDAT